MRVLVVDDTARVRTSISRALTLEGFKVDTAADAREAQERISPDSDVYTLNGMPWRPSEGAPPWAEGPLGSPPGPPFRSTWTPFRFTTRRGRTNTSRPTRTTSRPTGPASPDTSTTAP